MKTILGAALLFAAFGSATAQTASPMASDAMAGVPASAMKKVMHCKAMSHDAMMANATCMKMMKLYPAAFAGTASSN